MDLDKTFNWFENSDEFALWLRSYLSKRIPLTSSLSNLNSNDTISQLKKDISSFCSGDSQILFLTKVRASWNQKLRRKKRKSSYKTTTLEIKSEIYKDAVKIGKKYNIPINLAIEELLNKGCELEKEYIKQEQLRKKITPIKNKLIKKRVTEISAIPIKSNLKTITHEAMQQKLASEMLDKHYLEIQLIKLQFAENNKTMQEKLTEENKRYNKDCDSYNLPSFDIEG